MAKRESCGRSHAFRGYDFVACARLFLSQASYAGTTAYHQQPSPHVRQHELFATPQSLKSINAFGLRTIPNHVPLIVMLKLIADRLYLRSGNAFRSGCQTSHSEQFQSASQDTAS